MAQRIQFRRGTATQWTTANPILASGELGYETDTGKFKIGNGTAAWGTLSYFAGGTGGSSDPLQMVGNQVKLVYRATPARWEFPDGTVPVLTGRTASITWEGTAAQIPAQGTGDANLKVGDTAVIRTVSL